MAIKKSSFQTQSLSNLHPNHKQSGFTILTMLIAMTIIIITLPILAYTTKSVVQESNYEELSIEQFFQFFRDDLIRAEDIRVNTNIVYFNTADERDASISQYNDLVRRQVVGKGHEIYLRDIKEITFSPLPYGIHIALVSLKGAHYEKTFAFYQ